MKIDDMIEQLQIFKNEFGNLNVLIPEVIERSDYNSYSRKTIFNDCKISVCSYKPLECAVVIDKC